MFERYFWPCPECGKMCKKALNPDKGECAEHGEFSLAEVETKEAQAFREEICPSSKSTGGKREDDFPSSSLLTIAGSTTVV